MDKLKLTSDKCILVQVANKPKPSAHFGLREQQLCVGLAKNQTQASWLGIQNSFEDRGTRSDKTQTQAQDLSESQQIAHWQV